MRIVFVGAIPAREPCRANMRCQSSDVALVSPGHIPAKENPTGVNMVWRVKVARLFRRIAPFLGALAALLLVVMVLISMQLSSLDWQWIAFFAGVVSTAIVTMGSRPLRSERLVTRRNTQLALAHQQTARESALRHRVELNLADTKKRHCLFARITAGNDRLRGR